LNNNNYIMSTKTMVKDRTKNKEIRVEMVRDMKDKEMKIKELSEEILKLKVEKNIFEANQLSLLNMNQMRAEIKAADRFIKSVLKDNLMNYEIISQVAEEERASKGKVSRQEISNRFRMDSLSQINFDNCNCSTCITNRFIQSSSQKDPFFVSNFNLTDRLFMACHFDNLRYSMNINNSEGKTKEVTYRNKSDNKIMMKLKFLWRKEEDNYKEDIKFNSHEASFFIVSNMNLNFKVSLSAFLVVKAMREQVENQMDHLDKMRKMNEKSNQTCFSLMFEKLMGKRNLDSSATNMSYLLEEEEMEILTNHGDKDVFYKIEEEKMTSLNNHIQMDEFEGSSKIKLYMLSTPLMRKVHFFMEDEFEYIEAEIKNKMVLEESYDETENTMEQMNKEMNEYLVSVYKEMLRHSGNLVGDFSYHQFIKMHSNKGFDEKILNLLFQSNLSNCFFQNSFPEISTLLLFNIPYGLFLTIMMFTNDIMAFSNMILNKDLNLMKQCVTNIRNMFCKVWFDQGNLSMTVVKEKWVYTMSNIKSHPLFADPVFKRMFFEFKRRVFHQIMMWKMSKDLQQNFNSFESTESIKNKLEKDDIGKIFFYNRKKFQEKAMVDITKHQPTVKIGDSFLEWSPLDMMNSNEMTDFMMEMESKVRKN
jgi:hypothetical protein